MLRGSVKPLQSDSVAAVALTHFQLLPPLLPIRYSFCCPQGVCFCCRVCSSPVLLKVHWSLHFNTVPFCCLVLSTVLQALLFLFPGWRIVTHFVLYYKRIWEAVVNKRRTHVAKRRLQMSVTCTFKSKAGQIHGVLSSCLLSDSRLNCHKCMERRLASGMWHRVLWYIRTTYIHTYTHTYTHTYVRMHAPCACMF
jgi:hypothetical protein